MGADIDDYLDAARAEAGLARASLRSYRTDLEALARWAGRRGLHIWADLDTQGVVDHLASRRASGAREASVARGLVSLRMLLRFLILEGSLDHDPTARVPAPVLSKLLPHTLSPEQVSALLRSPQGTGWMALRDRALLELLYACGARIGEVVRLGTHDLEPKLRVLRLHGKGDKMRVVPVGNHARTAVEEWLRLGRPQVAREDRIAHLLITRNGKPLDRVNAWRRVKRAAQCAGLPTTITPHSLRHSFASHLIQGGADLRSVQEMLGHASIRTTEVYTHLDEDHVRAVHRLYHPRG